MTIQSTQSLISVDSRETSREWIKKTIPAGTKIAIESYSPYIDPEKYQVVSFGEIIEKDPNWYQQNGIDYIVASEGMYGRFFLEPNKYENEVQLYNNIFSAFTLAMLFNDGNYEIRIYRIK